MVQGTDTFSQYGLNLSNQNDLKTLLAPVGSAAAGRFQNKLPFAGFPSTGTVAQSLRPLPQFTTIGLINPPLGGTWYNSLQVTANKRFSHGLQFDFAFTWSKSLDTFAGTSDVQNRALAKGLSNLDQPRVMRVGATYTLPKWGPKGVSFAVRDWMINGFLYYASGTPLAAPTANTTGYAAGLAQATIANVTFQNGVTQRQVRTGQPLYLKDLDCHCFDPNNTFVLNPAAWANPAAGQFGSQTYYGDFRGQRRPVENFSFGRQFQIRERMRLNVRAEFTNVFNRAYFSNPSLVNPQTAPVCKQASGANGTCSQPGLQIVSGFGSIGTSSLAYPPRTGQLVAQIQF